MMNKLIENLISQCENHGTWENRTYTFDKEKFAAMIIQECINLDFSDFDYISIEGENRVRDIIKEHFGVE